MSINSLIKTPSLTRELSNELSGIGVFISDKLKGQPGTELFSEELEDFDKSSAKLKLHSFFMLYNDFEGLLLSGKGTEQITIVRREMRLKFPYLSAQEQMMVYFLPDMGQQGVISCFFLSEVICRVMEIHGQSRRLKAFYDDVESYFSKCKSPNSLELTPEILEEILILPAGLFDIMSSSLGKNWILNLYQRTFDRLQSQYSNLPAFAHLQRNMEEIFAAY